MEIFKPKQESGLETRRSPDRAGEGDRRRGTWRDFRRAYPGFVFVLGLGLVAMLAVDAWLLAKRFKYNQDVAQLREHMTAAERADFALKLQAESAKLQSTSKPADAMTNAQAAALAGVSARTLYQRKAVEEKCVAAVQRAQRLGLVS